MHGIRVAFAHDARTLGHPDPVLPRKANDPLTMVNHHLAPLDATHRCSACCSIMHPHHPVMTGVRTTNRRPPFARRVREDEQLASCRCRRHQQLRPQSRGDLFTAQ